MGTLQAPKEDAKIQGEARGLDFCCNYTDTPREIPAELLTGLYFFHPENPDAMKQMAQFLMERVLTKEKCWENEREWRIVLGDTDCKIPVDAVSALVIDERALDKENARELIRLCEKRGWTVKVRRSRPFHTFHSYETLDGKAARSE